MTTATPLRNPDASAPHLMTKRGWWLVGMNILLPGSAQLVAGDRRLGRVGIVATLLLWLLVLIGLLVALVTPSTVYTLATQAGSLTVVQIALILYAVLWVVLTLDTLRLVRLVRAHPNARGWIAAFAVLVLVGLAGTAGYGSVVAGSTPLAPPQTGSLPVSISGRMRSKSRVKARATSPSLRAV